MLTTKENIRAILECNFAGFKDEYIEIALDRIMEIINDAPEFKITEEQAIDKLHETGWLIEHDKEMTERPHGKWIKQEWGYVCSVCGESNDYAYDNNIHKFTDNFCPHCGADMRGEEEMKKNVEVEINISGEDLAKELWRSDAVEQANFLLELARIYRFYLPNFLMQLDLMSDELKDKIDKDLIIRVLEHALEFIRGEEDDIK